jgi:hypothetical protein
MKKIIAISFIFFLISCGSDEKIIGKWKRDVQGKNYSATEVCSYFKNKTETCDIDYILQTSGLTTKIKYVITQEWELEKDTISEKYLDVKIKEISVGHERLLPSDSRYQTIAEFIFGDKPKGKTLSRKIVFKKDMFDLYQSDGEISKYYKIK